jgi:hypothetical protein
MQIEKLYLEDPKYLFLSIHYPIYVPDGNHTLTFVFRATRIHLLNSQSG